MLIGGEKTVNEALREALELRAVFLDARPHKTSTKTLGEPLAPHPAKGFEKISMLKLWKTGTLRG
jgi:hypothetical protein